MQWIGRASDDGRAASTLTRAVRQAGLRYGVWFALLCSLPGLAQAASARVPLTDPHPQFATPAGVLWLAQSDPAAPTGPAEPSPAAPDPPPSDASAPSDQPTEDAAAKPTSWTWSAGLATGLPPIPVEGDLTGTGVTLEFFLEAQWHGSTGVHVALNHMSAEVNGTNLEVAALAVAYRYPVTLTDRLTGHLLGGLAHLAGTLSSASGSTSLRASTIALFAGAGLGTQWQAVYWSLEARLQSGAADFEGLTLDLGSNQLLFAGAYRF
jgi:hypothetical protein